MIISSVTMYILYTVREFLLIERQIWAPQNHAYNKGYNTENTVNEIADQFNC